MIWHIKILFLFILCIFFRLLFTTKFIQKIIIKQILIFPLNDKIWLCIRKIDRVSAKLRILHLLERGNDNSSAQTLNSSSVSGFATRSAAVRRCFFPAARTSERSRRNTKTTIYDCRRLRSELISPDFTSAPSNRPFPSSLSSFFFSPTSSSSSFSSTSCRMRVETRQKEIPRCPSRAPQKRAVRSLITTVHGGCIECEGRREEGGGWSTKGETERERKRNSGK